MGVVLQFWFWLTPIVYTEDILPARFRVVLRFNPLTHLVRAYHDIFVYRRFSLSGIGLPMTALLAVSLLAFAYLIYKRAVGDLVDEL